MYLHKLEKDERTAFLAFARHLALVDDAELDQHERYMVLYMCHEMGLAEEDIPTEPFDFDAFRRVFYREEARRIAILEGLGVILANGTRDPGQVKVLQGLARDFQLGEDFLRQAEELVDKQVKLMDEFDTLVSPPST